MRLRYTWFDVFAPGPLQGNQLCVFTAPADLSVPAMAALTRELGHSETTFLQPADTPEADVRVRIFITGGGGAQEIPFAGHPLLGSACAAAPTGGGAVTVRLQTGAGIIPVTVAPDGPRRWQARMAQPLPRLVWQRAAPPGLAAALGLPPAALRPDLPVAAVDNGMQTVIVPLRSVAAVQQARPDLAALAAAFGRDGACVLLFALGSAAPPAANVHVRVFSPFDHVPEDPATGSANGPLGEYLVRHGVLPGPTIVSEQGLEMGRPSRLTITVERMGGRTTAVYVGGQVIQVGSGEMVR